MLKISINQFRKCLYSMLFLLHFKISLSSSALKLSFLEVLIVLINYHLEVLFGEVLFKNCFKNFTSLKNFDSNLLEADLYMKDF